MKLPRDLTGSQLVKKLTQLGYQITRQTGSHLRLTCKSPSEHHVTIPNHNPLRIGTLSSILSEVATHHRLSREDLLKELFSK